MRDDPPSGTAPATMTWASAASRRAELSAALADCAARLRPQLPVRADEPVDLLVVFVSETHADHFEHLADLLQRVVPHRHLLGCSAAGVIGDGAEIEAAPGLAMSAAMLPGVDLHPLHLTRATLPAPDDAPAWEAALGVTALDRPGFVVLTEPSSFDPQPLIAGLDSAWPAAVKIGGLASGRRRALWLDGQLHDVGAVALAMTGNVRLDAVVSQGCRPIAEPMFVTRCRGNVLYELDGQPALDVLTRLAATLDHRDRERMPESLLMGLAAHAAADAAPQDYLVREIVGAIPDRGAIVVAAELTEHLIVRFHVRDRLSSATDLNTLLGREQQAGDTPRGALLFSCVARGVELYDEPDHDSRALREAFGELPIAGFFGNGEIGPMRGRTWLHGCTSAVGLFRPRDEP